MSLGWRGQLETDRGCRAYVTGTATGTGHVTPGARVPAADVPAAGSPPPSLRPRPASPPPQMVCCGSWINPAECGESWSAAHGHSSVDTLARWISAGLCPIGCVTLDDSSQEGLMATDCRGNTPYGNGLSRNTDENLTTAAHVSATAADVRSAAAAGLCAAGLCSSTTVRSTATNAVVMQRLRSGAHGMSLPLPHLTRGLSISKVESPRRSPHVNGGSSRHSGRDQTLTSRLGFRKTSFASGLNKS